MAARANGELLELASPLPDAVRNGTTPLEPITLDSDEGLDLLRHSTAHVMAAAVQKLFPGTKVTIGPAIDKGFYYDFDPQRPFSVEDFAAIEAEMRALFPEKKIGFRNCVDAELSVRALPDLFEASIRTIIENGVKYSGSEPEITVSAEKDVDKTWITVSDNGDGIAKERIKNIFEPYYTSDNKNGTGIGLHYARSIIQAHGGIIVAQSVPGKGSSFTITIPN